MKNKLLTITLIIAVMVLSLTLLIKQDVALQFLGIRQVHAYLHTSDNERFPIHMMITKQHTFYTETDYIYSTSIVSDNDVVPLDLNQIMIEDYPYVYEGNTYFPVTMFFQMAVLTEDTDIQMENATLRIEYTNQEYLEVNIGEFVYLFNEITTDIAVGNMISNHQVVNNIDTSVGVMIELTNTSEEIIEINEMNLPTTSIKSNSFYLTRVEETIKFDDSIEQIINIDYYDYYKTFSVTQNAYIIRPNESIMLYVPFSFENTNVLLHRFPIVITYAKENRSFTTTIDDFPYINRNPFQLQNEDLYEIYTIQHSN